MAKAEVIVHLDESARMALDARITELETEQGELHRELARLRSQLATAREDASEMEKKAITEGSEALALRAEVVALKAAAAWKPIEGAPEGPNLLISDGSGVERVPPERRSPHPLPRASRAAERGRVMAFRRFPLPESMPPVSYVQKPTRPGAPEIEFTITSRKLSATPPGAQIDCAWDFKRDLSRVTLRNAETSEVVCSFLVEPPPDVDGRTITTESMELAAAVYWSWWRGTIATEGGAS